MLIETNKTDALQPLREVGSVEKSDYWDREDIMQALRQANLRGVPLEALYAKPSRHTARLLISSKRVVKKPVLES